MVSPHHSPQILYERLVARLRVRHLRLMAALGQHSTLADAAREANLTQPAASQMLLDLEDLLSVRLFERHRRGVRPTEAGRFLSRQSIQLLLSVRHTADGLAALAVGRQRPLRIGAISAAMVTVLQPRLSKLRGSMRDLELNVQEGEPVAVNAGLLSGSLDLALLRMPEDTLHAPWAWMPLLDDDMAVVAAPGHPMARRRSVALAELSALPWSLPQPGFATHEAFSDACRASGFTPKPGPWQCVSVELLPALTEDRRTLAAVPRALVAPALARRSVREVRLKSPVPLPPVGAVWNTQDAHPGIERLLGLLKDSSTDVG